MPQYPTQQLAQYCNPRYSCYYPCFATFTVGFLLPCAATSEQPFPPIVNDKRACNALVCMRVRFWGVCGGLVALGLPWVVVWAGWLTQSCNNPPSLNPPPLGTLFYCSVRLKGYKQGAKAVTRIVNKRLMRVKIWARKESENSFCLRKFSAGVSYC